MIARWRGIRRGGGPSRSFFQLNRSRSWAGAESVADIDELYLPPLAEPAVGRGLTYAVDHEAGEIIGRHQARGVEIPAIVMLNDDGIGEWG